MAVGDIIVGIDIGTSKVSTVVGEVNDFNQIEVICNTECKCTGFKKAKIVDQDAIATAISQTIKEAEEIASLKINSAYVAVPGMYITIVQNAITKETKDKYAGISTKDVSSAIMQIKDIEIPSDKVLIDIVPDKFILDNGSVVDDPIGNLSSTFTLRANNILVDKEYVKELSTIFKKISIEIDGLIPIVLAERSLVLDTNELNDNVLLLDIGAGNTDIGVFENSSFLYTNTILLGGNNITSDIAIVLNISIEEAERLKRQYALALKSFIDNDNTIILNTYKGEEKNKSIKSSELIEIIEARVEEIFSLVNKNLIAQGLKAKINNVILTGQGITNINKSDVAGKIILNIPVKIATGRFISTINHDYRTAFAIVKYVAAKPFARTVSSSIDTKTDSNFFKNFLEKIKDFFYS